MTAKRLSAARWSRVKQGARPHLIGINHAFCMDNCSRNFFIPWNVPYESPPREQLSNLKHSGMANFSSCNQTNRDKRIRRVVFGSRYMYRHHKKDVFNSSTAFHTSTTVPETLRVGPVFSDTGRRRKNLHDAGALSTTGASSDPARGLSDNTLLLGLLLPGRSRYQPPRQRWQESSTHATNTPAKAA